LPSKAVVPDDSPFSTGGFTSYSLNHLRRRSDSESGLALIRP
jgi:hypothetical protein